LHKQKDVSAYYSGEYRLLEIIDYMAKIARTIELMGKDDPIFIFSHIDADGITSAAIIVTLLRELNKPFVLNFLPQITPEIFDPLWEDIEPRYVLFLDLGSDVPLKYIESTSSVSIGIVIDHHIVSKPERYSKGLIINPRVWGIDGGSEVSTSGMAFLLSNTVDGFFESYPHTVFYAITGALGDAQDVGVNRSLIGINHVLVKYGNQYGVLRSHEDYILIGKSFKPLYRLLAETFIFEIPGVTGSYEGALDFLVKNGIVDVERDSEKIFWDQLTPERKDMLRKKLLEALILKYSGKHTIEELNNILMGCVYEFVASMDFFCRYARDLSMLLNACGKMRAPEIGVGGLIEPSNKSIVQQMFQLYERYRAVLSSVFKNLESKVNFVGKIAIYDGRDEVHEELTSTISSILASSLKDKAKIVIAVARSVGDSLKVSLRKTALLADISLAQILKKIMPRIPSMIGGGHESAAGAYIPERHFDEFIELLNREITYE